MEHHGPIVMDATPSMANEPPILALSDAIQHEIAANKPQTGECSPELARAIRAVCAFARQHDLRAEQVILLFKSMWEKVPAADRERSPRRSELLERAVTLCIKTYYSIAD